eukprot:7262837-Prymnesium_polylepis.1
MTCMTTQSGFRSQLEQSNQLTAIQLEYCKCPSTTHGLRLAETDPRPHIHTHANINKCPSPAYTSHKGKRSPERGSRASATRESPTSLSIAGRAHLRSGKASRSTLEPVAWPFGERLRPRRGVLTQ